MLTVTIHTNKNYPKRQAGTLLVYQNHANGEDGCVQVYIPFSFCGTYQRLYSASLKTWSEWREVIFAGDYGLGGKAYQISHDLNNVLEAPNSGFYQVPSNSPNVPYASALGINQRLISVDGKWFCNLFFDYEKLGSIYYNSNRGGDTSWQQLITTANIADYNIPVGIPQPWPTSTPPTGWLKCNGATFDKTLYPKLAIAYPTCKLPDLCGEFIRGYDDDRGIDSDRTILSNQGDAIRNIKGSFRANGRSWDADKEGGVFYRMIDSVQGNGSSGDGCPNMDKSFWKRFERCFSNGLEEVSLMDETSILGGA